MISFLKHESHFDYIQTIFLLFLFSMFDMDMRGVMVEACTVTISPIGIHVNRKLVCNFKSHMVSISPAVIVRFIKGDSSSRRRVWMLP